MGEGYTDSKGRFRPIDGKKGRSGFAVAAGATALAMMAYSGGGAVTTGGASSVAAESISIRTNSGKKAARKGQHDKVWQQMRLKVRKQRSPQQHFDCALHSFGEVREFFVRAPCRSLSRTLVPLADEQGNTFVVSIAWVRMPTSRTARALDRLDYRDGTGDVTALGHNVLTSRGISFTGEHYEARVKSKLFVRAEAAPVSGNPAPELLDGSAEAASLLPPP